MFRELLDTCGPFCGSGFSFFDKVARFVPRLLLVEMAPKSAVDKSCIIPEAGVFAVDACGMWQGLGRVVQSCTCCVLLGLIYLETN